MLFVYVKRKNWIIKSISARSANHQKIPLARSLTTSRDPKSFHHDASYRVNKLDLFESRGLICLSSH